MGEMSDSQGMIGPILFLDRAGDTHARSGGEMGCKRAIDHMGICIQVEHGANSGDQLGQHGQQAVTGFEQQL